MKDWQFILKYNGVTKELTNNPAGWDKFTISFIRNETYHSVLRTITESLRYVSTLNDGGGYNFINDAYEDEGIKAVVTLTINQRNINTNGYEFFYGGILNFTPGKWKRDETEVEFEIGTIDSAKLQNFKANEDVDIDLNSTTSLNGTTITAFVNSPEQTTFKKIDLYLKSITNGFFTGSGNEPTGTTLTFYTDLNGNLPLNEMGDRLTINFPALDPPEGKNLYINSINSPEQNADFYCTTFAGKSEANITIDDSPSGQVWDFKKTIIFTVYDSDSVFQESLEQIIHTDSGTGNESGLGIEQDYSFSFNAFTVETNGYITMQTEIELVTGGTGIDKTVGSTTTVSNAIFYELTEGAADSAVDVFLPAEAFDRGIQLTTNETDTTKLVYSEKFGRTDSEFTTYSSDGDAAYYSYNTGWNIRGYPDKPFLTTFKNMFKSYDAAFNLCFIHDRNNDSFIIADKTEAYKDEEILRIENISDIIIEPSNKYYYKQILSGYPKMTFEDFQGVNEINLESEHYIDTPVKTKLDVRSIASASSVAIELARRKAYRTNASEDTKYDEFNYIVEVFQNGLLLETVQGVTDYDGWEGGEQYYNWSITPRENLVRWQGFINTPGFKETDPYIDKTKYQKESNAEYRNAAGLLVNEFDRIGNSELGSPRIYPEEITFKGLFTKDTIDQLNTDPHGYITGVDGDGTEYKGFIISVEGNPSDKQGTYKLIRANV